MVLHYFLGKFTVHVILFCAVCWFLSSWQSWRCGGT